MSETEHCRRDWLQHVRIKATRVLANYWGGETFDVQWRAPMKAVMKLRFL